MPTVFYACATWTLTTELKNRLRRAQRRMLRMILGSPRRRDAPAAQPPYPPDQLPFPGPSPPPDHISDASDVASDAPDTTVPPCTDDETGHETWTDWIKRCTYEAERQLGKLGIDDWATIQHRRKAAFAEKVINKPQMELQGLPVGLHRT